MYINGQVNIYKRWHFATELAWSYQVNPKIVMKSDKWGQVRIWRIPSACSWRVPCCFPTIIWYFHVQIFGGVKITRERGFYTALSVHVFPSPLMKLFNQEVWYCLINYIPKQHSWNLKGAGENHREQSVCKASNSSRLFR
jgi:hypothetical protein